MNCLTEEIHKVCLTQFTKPGFAVYSACLCVINDSFLRKKKKRSIMRSFSLSKLHLCLEYQHGRLSSSTSLPYHVVWRCIDFLRASCLLLSQHKSPWFSLNCLWTPWHSLFFCFSFFPPSLPEAGMRRITVQSPTLLWSEQVSPHIMSK